MLLDSANNVPAAISAYTQSVRLLKEVMARVEEGSRRERERDRERGLDRAGPRPGETEEDVAKRVAKMERKERAKVDEARRLRVIVRVSTVSGSHEDIATSADRHFHVPALQHDTYEERIRMLLSMGTNPSDPIGPGSTPSTPSTLHSDSPTASPPPPLGHRHRSSRSISSLSTVSTPPASFAPALNGTAPPTVVVQSSTPHQDPSRTTNSSLSLSEDEWTPAAEGIGSAMLLSSPPASPMDPMMPSSRPTPTLSSLRIVEESGPSQLQQRLLPHMARGRSGDTINEGDAESDNDLPPRSRSSISSDGTATDMSRTLTVAAPSDPSTHYANSSFRPSPPREPSPPPHIDIKPSSPLDAALRDLVISVPSPTDSTSPMGPTDSHQRTHSMGSSESDDVVPVTALDYGVGWPRDHSSGVVPANGVPTSDSTVTADSFRPTSVGSSDTMHRTHSAQTSATSEGMRATRSGDSMQRTASGESVSGVSTRGSSLFGPGGFARMTTLGPNSSPEDPSRQSASPFGLGPPPSASANAASRPRPSRSASLATPPTFSHAPPVPSKKDRLPLVSSSTALGTISQRRQRSPHPSLSGIPTSHYTDVQDDKEEREHVVQHDGYDLPARPGRLASAARPVSAERTVASEFGLQPHTTGPSGSYVSASLPTRLRTLSQPGKRPQLQSFQSEQPPLPPLLVAGNRSFSGSGAPSYGRKASIPTPTSLNAPTFPPLGRSNSSSSSHGSHHSDRNPGHFTSQSQADTPTSSNFSRPSGGVSNTTVSTLSNPPPPSSEVTSLGLPAIRRPFFLMRQLLSTIESPGAYLTARLYVPPQVWTQGGVKLVALETKVRMLDLLLTGLDGVDKAGSAFLNAGEGQGRWAAAEFVKELDAFEGLTDGIQSTLSKKLGYGTSGKKMGAVSLSFSEPGRLKDRTDRPRTPRRLRSALGVQSCQDLSIELRMVESALDCVCFPRTLGSRLTCVLRRAGQSGSPCNLCRGARSGLPSRWTHRCACYFFSKQIDVGSC